MNVRIILSRVLSEVLAKSVRYCKYLTYIRRAGTQKELDNKPAVDIIIFTGHLAHESAAPPPPPTKTPDASPPWHPQPTSGSRQSSSVSQQRLLRLRRPDAGQVRDAAQGSHRQQLYQRVRAGLRLLSPIVLSGAGRAVPGRRVRFAPAQAPPPRGGQHDRPRRESCIATA